MATLEISNRIIIKIGSAILVDSEKGVLREDWLDSLCKEVSELKVSGKEVTIVSSGAIALGRSRLGLQNRKLTLSEKQACAAAGQSLLTLTYEKALNKYGITTAQALLTLNDTEDRRRWLNARSTLDTLLLLGAVPVINENDTVATDEIRYGDNDRLAARTAQMIGSDTLILLTDIDGLYTSDPRLNTNAQHVPQVEVLTDEIMEMGTGINTQTNLGSGGMATKLIAARIATQAGCRVCIMDGRKNKPLQRLNLGERATWFTAKSNPKSARIQWISGTLKPSGSITIDEGAVKALKMNKSLLPAGAISLSGNFYKGDAVMIIDENNLEIARGLVSYDKIEAEKIIGFKSEDISNILGYENGPVLIHRDNLVVMQHAKF
mgnify:CR=1 FL=1